MKHAQFCPIAKASEVIGERWMLLVIRELLAGATGFTELQRGLGSISPSVLSSRLRTLAEHGAARHWWLRIAGGETELCAEFPGRAEDVTLTCRLRTMAEVFSGDIQIKAAVAEGLLKLEGLPKLTRNVQHWLRPSAFANVELPKP